MKRFPIPALIAAVLLAAPAARALTFLELATGDDALFPDARSVAMGRTRVAEDAGAFTGTANPARLAWLDGGRVSLGGGVQKLKETRSIPAFDSFDGYLTESVYVLNDGYQYRGGLGAVAPAPPEWGLGALGVGFSFAPVRDFQYDYSEEVRDNNAFTRPRDRLIAVNEVQADGTLDAWTFAAGWAPHPVASVGASLQALRGKRDIVQRVRYTQVDAELASMFNVNELSGVRGLIGVSVRPSHRIDAAATFKTETTLEGDFLRKDFTRLADTLSASVDTTGTIEITYPRELAFGLAYRPQAKVRTTLRLEATWTEWSEFDHPLWADLVLNDVWGFGLGLEHTFYNGFPVRFGFHYRPSPENNEVTTTTFTFGGGLDVGPLHADLGFEVANRDYRYEDLFDDDLFGGTSRTEKDSVDESSVTGYGTVSWALPGLGG